MKKNPSSLGNHSRVDFTFPYWQSWQGKLLQNVIKPAIIAFANRLGQMILHYDPDAFAFDDPRLNFMQFFLKRKLEETMPDHSHKMQKACIYSATNFCLWLLKEDIFYRARFFDAMQEYEKQHGSLELTDLEKANLEKWSQ